MNDDDDDDGDTGITFLMVPLPIMLWALVAFALVALGTICVGAALLIHLLEGRHA